MNKFTLPGVLVVDDTTVVGDVASVVDKEKRKPGSHMVKISRDITQPLSEAFS